MGNGQVVRWARAEEKPEDVQHARIRPPHPWPHRSGGIRTSAGHTRRIARTAPGISRTKVTTIAKSRQSPRGRDTRRKARGRLMVVWVSFGPRRTGSEEGLPSRTEGRTGTSSRLVVLRLVVGCPGLRFGLIVFDRLLDDLPLDERLGRDRFADDPARDGVRQGNSRRSSGGGSGCGFRSRKRPRGGRGSDPVAGPPPGPGEPPPPPPPPRAL